MPPSSPPFLFNDGLHGEVCKLLRVLLIHRILAPIVYAATDTITGTLCFCQIFISGFSEPFAIGAQASHLSTIIIV
jgi:hypothetical protein